MDKKGGGVAERESKDKVGRGEGGPSVQLVCHVPRTWRTTRALGHGAYGPDQHPAALLGRQWLLLVRVTWGPLRCRAVVLRGEIQNVDEVRTNYC